MPNRVLPQFLSWADPRDMDIFFDTEEAHVVMLGYAAYRYPVMSIFSRRYLLASRDVVTEVGFK